MHCDLKFKGSWNFRNYWKQKLYNLIKKGKIHIHVYLDCEFIRNLSGNEFISLKWELQLINICCLINLLFRQLLLT